MKKRIPLILEQLEDRIFLDANPLVLVDAGTEPPAEIEGESSPQTVEVPPPTDSEEEAVPEPAGEETISNNETEGAEEGSAATNVTAGDEQESGEEEVVEHDVTAEGDDIDLVADPKEIESESGVTELIVVDTRVSGHEQLVVDLTEIANEQNKIIEIVVVEGGESGVGVINDRLANHDNTIQTVRIYSHGDDGRISLGTDTLSGETLELHSPELADWSNGLSEEADILFYGCDVAESEQGRELVDRIGVITGADVAASTDATGTAPYGDNWKLEYESGEITADELIQESSVIQWQGALAPTPTATVNIPAEELIEETVSFSVTFDNTGAPGDIGYAPYIDVYIPVGLDVQSGPSYGSAGLQSQKFVWDSAAGTGGAWIDGGTIIDPDDNNHPFDSVGTVIPVKAGINDGDVWYVVELPFGSFTPEQPSIDIGFTAELDQDAVQPGAAYAPGDAVVGTPLEVSARAGFRYGSDPIDNPNTDPPIVGSETSDAVTPTLIEITKTSDAPEGQTVTGPNYPVTYTVQIDIAPEQLVTDLVIHDFLPNSAYYRDDYVITGATVLTGDARYDLPIVWQANNSPDNDFFLPLGDVTGDSADDTVEITLVYSVYYGETDADGADVLNACSGNDSLALNEANATSIYDHPINGVQTIITGDVNSDDGGPGALDSDNSDYQNQLNSITTLKSVAISNDTGATGLTPGDTLTYTIEFEISDYFGFANLKVSDLLGDGQHLVGTGLFEDPALATDPTLTIHENGVTQQYEWDLTTLNATGVGDSFTVSRNLSPGTTEIVFDVSALIGGGGELHGDLFAGDSGTPDSYTGGRPGQGTRGTITFDAIVDDNYLNTAIDTSVDHGDPIDNDVTISGDILDKNNPGSTCGSEDDASETHKEIVGIETDKDITHINGVAYLSGQKLSPGDVVTYAFTMELPTGDIQNLNMVDYLPLPVFDVTEFGPNPVFGNTVAPGNPVGSYDLTVGGIVYWGDETDLQYASGIISPSSSTVISTDTTANTLSVELGTFNVQGGAVAPDGKWTLQILTTVTVQNIPYADGLNLTNQATWSYDNSFGEEVASGDIDQVEVISPDVQITKGVIATDSLDAVNQEFIPVDPSPTPADLTVNVPGADPSLVINGTLTGAELLGTPLDSDLLGIDGSDFVTFGISLVNAGGSEAYGLQIRDTRPEGFAAPVNSDPASINLQVWSGKGTQLVYNTDYTVGAEGFFDIDGVAGNDGITFLTALDGDRLGVIGNSTFTTGDDVFIITYDLQVDNEYAVNPNMAEAGSTQTNTASIAYFTGDLDALNDGGTPGDPTDDTWDSAQNWVDPSDPPSDDASVSIDIPTITKELMGSEIGAGDIDGNNEDGVNEEAEAVIGERVEYQVKITVPEGKTVAAVLSDHLDRGLELVSIDSIEVTDENGNTRDGVLRSSLWGDNFDTFVQLTDASNTNISYTYAGRGSSSFQLLLGDVENVADDDGTDEVIVINYTAMVVNDSHNNHGSNKNNAATLSYNVPTDSGTDTITTSPESALNIKIIEPQLRVVKTVEVDGNASGPASQYDDQNNPDAVPGDAGDPVVYTMVIEHLDHAHNDKGATAFDVELSDLIPDELTNIVLVSAIHSGSGTDIKGNFSWVGNQLSTTTAFDLAYGETLTVEISADMKMVQFTSGIIHNEADIEWTSYADKPTASGFVSSSDIDTERTGDSADPGGSANDYNDMDPADITVLLVANKYIVNSEVNEVEGAGFAAGDDGIFAAPDDTDQVNSGREAVIGETLTYKVEIILPEAEFPGVVARDILDPGLTLVSIDSINLIDTDPKPGSVFVQHHSLFTLPPITDDSNPYISYTPDAVNGDKLEIDFGYIFNTNDDNTIEERLEIVYTVMVSDVGANITDTQLDNAYQTSWVHEGQRVDGVGDSAETVEVLEPDLIIDKALTSVTGPGDAGDLVTYTITVEHSGTSEVAAYDLDLSDTFDVNIDPATLALSSAVIQHSDGSANTLVTGAFAIDGVSGELTTTGDLDLLLSPTNSDTLVLVVSGRLAQSVYPGSTADNSATVTWTSVDGVRDNYSDFTNNGEDQERLYTASDDAPQIVVPEPTVSKALIGTDVTDAANAALDEATIGEIITYEVTVNLVEGLNGSAQLVDSLSQGLEFVEIDTITISAGAAITTSLGNFSNVTTSTSGTGTTGQTVTFNLGDLGIAGDNTGTDFDSVGGTQGDDRLIIRYRAVVVDIPSNNAIGSPAETFDNSAVYSFTDATNTQHTSGPNTADPVTLVEPDLEVVKTVNNIVDPGALTGVDAGDAVSYEINVGHTGTSGSGAYGVTLNDLIPIELGTLSVMNVVTTGSLVLVAADFEISGNLLQFATSGPNTSATRSIDIMQVGDTFTVTIGATLLTAVQPNQDIVNTSSVDWTSLPDAHENNDKPNERGSGTDPDNVYHDEDDAIITIAGLDIAKTGTGTYTIGELVDFEIEVTVPEGTTENLVVLDDLPDGLIYESFLVAHDGSFTYQLDPPVDTPNTGDGNDVSFDFGQVVVSGNDPAADTFTITVKARVENIAANVAGTVLSNNASLTYIDGNSQSQTVAAAPVSITLIEPKIATLKTVYDSVDGGSDADGGPGDITADALGDTMTYTVSFTNTGTATAYDVTAQDLMDPGTGWAGGFPGIVSAEYYVGAALTGTPIATTANYANNIIDFEGVGGSWDIAVGDHIEVVYTADVLAAWFVAGNHVNVADADWSSLNDGDTGGGEERIYDDSAVANPGMSQDASQDTSSAHYIVGSGDVEIGDTVWYDADNSGGATMTAGDIGLAGVELNLEIWFNGTDYYYLTAITADGTAGTTMGEYMFAHLQDGVTYDIELDESTLPQGMRQTYSYNDGLGMDNSTRIVVPSSTPNYQFLDVDYSYTGIGSIGDLVWYDANQNGNFTDDPGLGINGVTVTLTAFDQDGDGNPDYTATTTTTNHPVSGDPGYYHFGNLPFVDYTVTVSNHPFGLITPTYDLDGVATADTTLVDAALMNSLTDVDTADFGYVGTGSIGDLVWKDIDADGVAESGELGFGGVTVILTGDLNGDSIDDTLSTTTLFNGSYHFNGLPVGTYTIQVDPNSLPSGFIQSFDYNWNVADGLNNDGLNDQASYTLALGETFNDIDFGYTKTGSIGDTVWFDANDNGVQDSGEPGLSGVSVSLVGDVDLDGVDDILNTVTDASGKYLFDDLPAGAYTVNVIAGTLPGGMRPTYDADGIATANTTTTNLVYAEDKRDIDFGYTGTGSIGDTVWYDANRNGLQDGGEAGITNVLMTLDADLNSDGIIDYTIDKRTDGSGQYLFENLPAGRYTITLDPSTLPSGLTQTYDPDSLMDGTSSIALGAGENNLAQDFAYAIPPVPPQTPQTLQPPQLSQSPTPQPLFREAPVIHSGDDGYNVDDFLEGPALSQRADVFQPALTTMPTMYTGHAEPGTMLYLTMYDAQGNVLATHMAPADTGGNWLANFQVAPDSEMPHRVVIQQSAAVYNRSTEGGFNLRTNFSPSFGSKAVTSVKGDVSSVMGGLAERVVEDLHRLYNGQVDVRWDSTSPYESTVTSTNPGQGSTL